MSSSVVRAMRILSFLAHSETPVALTPLATELAIPVSTAHKILREMVQEGFIESHPRGGFSIGFRAFEVGAARLRQTSAVDVVLPELARLTSELVVTSHFAVLDGPDAVYLCKHDPPGLGVQLASSVGARLPARDTAVGKASLAWLTPSEVTTSLGLAPDEVAGLTAELAAVRDRGYANDDGAVAAGVKCVAAPVFASTGCVGAIGISYVESASGTPSTMYEDVVRAASRASAALGGGTR